SLFAFRFSLFAFRFSLFAKARKQNKPYPMTAEIALQHLQRLFAEDHWPTTRRLVATREDPQPFVTANILAILRRTSLPGDIFDNLMKRTRPFLAGFQAGHRVYHWPLRNGVSAMANSRLWGRIPALRLSPDADNTCLQQLALREEKWYPAILEDLKYFRATSPPFRLPAIQAGFPRVEGSFLTWFPPMEQCRDPKLETVDLGVNANILWFLGETGQMETRGAAQTAALVRELTEEGFYRREPFLASPYYPLPAVLVYLLSRAIRWGNLRELEDLGPVLMRHAADIRPNSGFEWLCLANSAALWQSEALAATWLDNALAHPRMLSPFYVAPLAFPLAQRFTPFKAIAQSPLTHLKFESEALFWAMLFWQQSSLSTGGRGTTPATKIRG
ncbi:MAG TPA: hypothetical protein PKV71_05055, partial [Calditrichia bacterium]|nr:hypothetical protein [Calditrichia bacterium]